MASTPKLFMLLLGAKPKGRHTEQHDFFFGIANELPELVPAIKSFWPEAGDKIHIDAWREISFVDGYRINIIQKTVESSLQDQKLFFINLGGYQKMKFEEQHHTLLSVNMDMASAMKEAKSTLFFKQNTIPGATSHIDDKYALDVDDTYQIEDLLSPSDKKLYRIELLSSGETVEEDEMHLGYLKLSTLEKKRLKN